MATFRYGGVTPLDEPQIITGVEWSIECDRENATFEIKTPHGSLRLPVKVMPRMIEAMRDALEGMVNPDQKPF